MAADDDDLNMAELAELLGVDADVDVEQVRARIRALFTDARCAACQSYRVAVVSGQGHRCAVVQCRRCSHLSVVDVDATPKQAQEARRVEVALLRARAVRTGTLPSWSDWMPAPDRSTWPPMLRGAA